MSKMSVLVLACQLVALGSASAQSRVEVVNMVPVALSGETSHDREPNLAVNLADPNQIAASAFTPGAGVCGANLAPVYVSTDGGRAWAWNCIVPSDGSGMTSDIALSFGRASNTLYAAILRRPGFLRMNILRTNNFTGPAAMTVLVDRNWVDQPYVVATSAGGNDRVYVGNNDFNVANGRTAAVDVSVDAGAPCCPPPVPPPTFNTVRIEQRATSGQNGPSIRPGIAVAPDQTVYAAFFGWRNFAGGIATADVVVTRDDAGGVGPSPFTALVDPGDGVAGMRAAQGVTIPFSNAPTLGQERIGSSLSIAVDPGNSSVVYLAWADRVGANDYTLHVRRSVDRGLTWSTDLRTVTNATNPALAVSQDGVVGFLYQQVVGPAASQRWVTHLELSGDGFLTTEDLVLATVPANVPAGGFLPYIGDYVDLQAAGSDFYGIFSANNTPNNANFPNGVTYQRNANFATNTLLNTDNVTPVGVTIDPFFVRVQPALSQLLQSFASVNGVALVGDPATSSVVAYLGDGSAYPRNAGDAFTFAPIQLPHGKEITGFRCIVRDSSSVGYVQANLIRGPINTDDPVVGQHLIASAVTFPTTVSSGFLEITGMPNADRSRVDNNRYGYLLRVDFLDNPSGAGALLKLRGCSVGLR